MLQLHHPLFQQQHRDYEFTSLKDSLFLSPSLSLSLCQLEPVGNKTSTYDFSAGLSLQCPSEVGFRTAPKELDVYRGLIQLSSPTARVLNIPHPNLFLPTSELPLLADVQKQQPHILRTCAYSTPSHSKPASPRPPLRLPLIH